MEKFKILIVDDIKENLYSLKLLIIESFENVSVLEASNVKEALVQIMKNDIDMILTDIQMPETSGIDFAKYLEDIDETKDIPIMLITGVYNDPEFKKKAFRSSKNIVDYINKPIDNELLCSKLNVFINIFEQRKADKKKIKDSQKEIRNQKKFISMLEKVDKHFCDIINVEEDLKFSLREEADTVDINELLEKKKES
jgi:CheY-like chemotaxis protein